MELKVGHLDTVSFCTRLLIVLNGIEREFVKGSLFIGTKLLIVLNGIERSVDEDYKSQVEAFNRTKWN